MSGSAEASLQHATPAPCAHVRTVRLRHRRMERASEEMLCLPSSHILLTTVSASPLVGSPGSLQAGAAEPVVASPQRQHLAAAAVVGGRGSCGSPGAHADAGAMLRRCPHTTWVAVVSRVGPVSGSAATSWTDAAGHFACTASLERQVLCYRSHMGLPPAMQRQHARKGDRSCIGQHCGIV